MLQTAGARVDFLAVHNAYAPVNVDDNSDPRTVYAAMLAAPISIAQNLQAISQDIATFAPKGAQIPIAVTEWGPLFQTTTAGRYAEHTKTLGSALYDVEVLKALFESPATQIANFHVFNDLSIMCWICSSNGSYPVWTPTAEAMAFQLVRQHTGSQLVSSVVAAPVYTSQAIGLVSSIPNVPYLDVISSLSADGKTLYVIAVNKNFDQAIQTTLSIGGFSPQGSAAVWTLNGTGIDANTGTVPLQVPGVYWAPQAQDPLNPQFDNGGPGQVTLTQSNASVGSSFSYRFPAHSVTAIQMASK